MPRTCYWYGCPQPSRHSAGTVPALLHFLVSPAEAGVGMHLRPLVFAEYTSSGYGDAFRISTLKRGFCSHLESNEDRGCKLNVESVNPS